MNVGSIIEDFNGVSLAIEANQRVNVFVVEYFSRDSSGAQEAIVEIPWDNWLIHVHLNFNCAFSLDNLEGLDGDITLVIPQDSSFT